MIFNEPQRTMLRCSLWSKPLFDDWTSLMGIWQSLYKGFHCQKYGDTMGQWSIDWWWWWWWWWYDFIQSCAVLGIVATHELMKKSIEHCPSEYKINIIWDDTGTKCFFLIWWYNGFAIPQTNSHRRCHELGENHVPWFPVFLIQDLGFLIDAPRKPWEALGYFWG